MTDTLAPGVCPRCRKNPRPPKYGWCVDCRRAYHRAYGQGKILQPDGTTIEAMSHQKTRSQIQQAREEALQNKRAEKRRKFLEKVKTATPGMCPRCKTE